jgi:hypothetical protein
MPAMRPPISTLSWIEYPSGTAISDSGAGNGAAGVGFWAAAMPAVINKMAIPMPPVVRCILAGKG